MFISLLDNLDGNTKVAVTKSGSIIDIVGYLASKPLLRGDTNLSVERRAEKMEQNSKIYKKSNLKMFIILFAYMIANLLFGILALKASGEIVI